jgi:hypothetical protein
VKAAGAQLVPQDSWYTIETQHFRIHFPKLLENEGRSAAVNAERAWAELSTELRPPGGRVDIVVADNVDYVNGFASTLPSNRIVVFAHPPVDLPELRNYGDWSRLVITHELTHIFHLDRADGVWGFGRKIFGRHPALFPNAYMPAWIIEGLAVYYESRITGLGRLEGNEHYMIARAAAGAGRVPRLGELSRQTTRYPGGEAAYAYGAQVLDYISRTRGPESIPRFVAVSSKLLLPLGLNRKARRAFGVSFEEAWRAWRDSLVRSLVPRGAPTDGWSELTREGRTVAFPRWLGDTAILFTAANGKEMPGAYAVGLDGRIDRLGRRNSLDANVVLPDGSILFAQSEYVDAFHYRNDLWIEKDGEQTRITRGARLSHPDVSQRGEIVAVQNVPGSTVLVLVSRDGVVAPLMSARSDVQWAEPRWSPRERRIVAIRTTGGRSQIVLVDPTQAEASRLLVEDGAILSSPSWSPDGSRVFFTSTRSGVAQAYEVSSAGNNSVSRVTSASSGFFAPEVSAGSKYVAGLDFRFDGYHLGFAALPDTKAGTVSALILPRSECRECRLSYSGPATLSQEAVPAARRYSAWRSLLPTYWEPIVQSASGSGFSVGAATSGSDIVGRHAYYAEAYVDTDDRDTEAFAAYTYRGLGRPFISASASQEVEHFGIGNSAGDRVGDLRRRARVIGASASVVRPRARTFSTVAVGGDIESRRYTSDPDSLLAKLSPIFSRVTRYPSLFASAAWSNVQRPGLSISRENGISLSATVRQRWEAGEISNASRSVIGVAAGYRALDLPGFAHHVIALRGAAAIADDNAISTYSVGGLSGGSLDVVAGVALGGGRRTFAVRGFPPSAEQGTQAYAGTLEYRAPLAAPSRGVPLIPVFIDRISLAAFGDAGRASCPSSAQLVCGNNSGGPWLGSVGAEIDFDTAVQYDMATRFRLGFAVPVAGRTEGRARSVSAYFTVGSSF